MLPINDSTQFTELQTVLSPEANKVRSPAAAAVGPFPTGQSTKTIPFAAESGRHFAHGADAVCGKIDDCCSRGQTGGETVCSEYHLFRYVGVGQREQDYVRSGGEFARRRGATRSSCDQFIDGLGIDIENGDLALFAQDIHGHPAAHETETDETYALFLLHDFSSAIDVI